MLRFNEKLPACYVGCAERLMKIRYAFCPLSTVDSCTLAQSMPVEQEPPTSSGLKNAAGRHPTLSNGGCGPSLPRPASDWLPWRGRTAA